MKYIVLLRGINVGGKVVKMAELRKVMEEMGFDNVRTYIQSGNVVFDADEQNVRELTDKIARELAEAFGFDIPVVIRTEEEWEQIIAANPFPGEEPYVTLLSETPNEAGIEKLFAFKTDSADELKIHGREVYLLPKGGYGKTVYSNAFLEKKLGVQATTRNWKTMQKLRNY